MADPAGLGLQQSTVTVNGNNNLAYSGPSAALGGLSGSGSFNLPNSTLSVGANGANTNFTGTMGGAGGLTKVGSGTLLLSNSNVYAGPTEVDAGTLKLTNGNGLAISGFNNGTGWSVNSYAEATPAFSGGTATLTDNIFVSGQARAIWYDTPVATNGFSTTFIYTVGGNKVADGITFCLQTAGSSTAHQWRLYRRQPRILWHRTQYGGWLQFLPGRLANQFRRLDRRQPGPLHAQHGRRAACQQRQRPHPGHGDLCSDPDPDGKPPRLGQQQHVFHY